MKEYEESMIGEVFKYRDENLKKDIELEVIDDTHFDCLHCYFVDVNCNENGLHCASEERLDGDEVSFKLVREL